MRPLFPLTSVARVVILCVFGVHLLTLLPPATVRAELRAGAAVVDVTPVQFPVLVNGGMTSRSADGAVTKVNARAVVLDDGEERLAIVVVDSCMMPRPLLDEAKQLAAQRTKLRPDRILISATHTHTAPASMGCLGTDADPRYVPYLREKLAEAIAAAEANLEPARVGYAVADAAEYTAVRRWIRRPDRLAEDPFGNLTVRANMHAGRNWDDVTGESGPEDPDLTLIAFRTPAGRPIAALANFSMHYFSGVKPLNADYFGMFCEGFQQQLGSANPAQGKAGGKNSPDAPPFVALMSHGCSGDIWRRDYTLPADQQANPSIEEYTDGLLGIALKAYASIEYRDADLGMAEHRMELKYRVPDQQRLQWARQVMESLGDRPPKTQPEVYAREQLILHERQSTEVVVQAVRIGDIGIATTPNETYALTGYKIKLQSPLKKMMVIELANGGDGYIPPPEQHLLGGYNTWPARSAGLEVLAEPKITEAALSMLEQVAQRPRTAYRQPLGPAARNWLEGKPVAYWRLDDFSGPYARDASGNAREALYELPVAFFLAGPDSARYSGSDQVNRAVHLAGGRLRARLPLQQSYSVALWLWNGMPSDARETAGWVLSRGHDLGLAPHSEHLGVGGTATSPGKLVFQRGTDDQGRRWVGRTEIPRWTWSHVVLVRDQKGIRVHLNGNPQPEIEAAVPAEFPADFANWFLGGRCDNQHNWEGRLDEIVVYDRPLTAAEVKRLAGHAN